MVALGRQAALLSDAHVPTESVGQSRERRKRLRITGCYPARVRWSDSARGNIKHEATLDNLSSNGLYMRVRSQMIAGQKACVVFYMADVMVMPSKEAPAHSTVSIPAPRIAVRGMVLRTELLEEGLWGVVVVFRQHRFL